MDERPDIEGYIWLIVICLMFYLASPAQAGGDNLDFPRCTNDPAKIIKLERKITHTILSTWDKAGRYYELSNERLLAKAQLSAKKIVADNYLCKFK